MLFLLQIKNITIGEGRPKICVSIMGATKEPLIEQAKKANESPADIVEWRVDYFTDGTDSKKVIEVLKELQEVLTEKILLFTFRTKEEGGEQTISLGAYRDLYLVVANQGVDMVDLELARVEFLGRTFVQSLKEANTKIVMSSHNFEQTPVDGDLVFRVNVMKQLGADIGKIATMPKQLQDVLRIMGLVSKVRGFHEMPLAVMAMGDLGKVTRISGEVTGSVFTFGSLEEASAPGQIPVEQLDRILTLLQVEK